MRRHAFVALVLFGASGCSLLFDVSANEYIGPPAGRGGPDGEGPPDASQAADARADAPQTDAPQTDALQASPCASSHTICEDFDTGKTFEALGWYPDARGGAKVTINT